MVVYWQELFGDDNYERVSPRIEELHAWLNEDLDSRTPILTPAMGDLGFTDSGEHPPCHMRRIEGGISTGFTGAIAQAAGGLGFTAEDHPDEPISVLFLLFAHGGKQAVHVVTVLGRDFLADAPYFFNWSFVFHCADNLHQLARSAKHGQRQAHLLTDAGESPLNESIVDVPAIPREQEVHPMGRGEPNVRGIRPGSWRDQTGGQYPLG